jgi:hypothetical protein
MRNTILAITLLFGCAAAARAQEAPPSATPVGASGTTAPVAGYDGAARPSTSTSTSPAAAPARGTTEATQQAEQSPALSAGLAAPPDKSQPVRMTLFKAPPVIDGKLDDEVWKTAALMKDFYQTQPGDNIAPSQPTELLIGYDAKNLYLGFRAYDEAGKVRATVGKRDDIFNDDNVRVLLDTFDDKRRAYAFVFNPYGIQADGILTEGRGEDYTVDVVMESKGVVTDKGYTVEVAIPFRSLRYGGGKQMRWGIHVFRRIKRLNNELDSWMPISRDKSGLLAQQGYLTGFEGLAAERTLEVIPSLTLIETGRRVRTIPRGVLLANPALGEPGRLVNPPIEFDPGVTAKLSISSALTLALAVNPDFAQVEADQLVVTANQRFPIFYPERRPFFLEGIEIFQTPLTAVHTRAIVDPDVAIKLTGKRGRTTFGLMAASDNGPGNYSADERTDPLVLPSIQRFLDKNAQIGVLRIKRDLGKENSLGFLATTYDFVERHNRLGGFDGRFRLDPKTTLSFQVLGSTSRRFFFDPDLGRSVYRTGNGFAYLGDYIRTGRNLEFEVYGEGYSQDYRADVGFITRTSSNYNAARVQYTSTPNPKGRLINWSVENYAHMDYDMKGRMYTTEDQTTFNFNLPRQSVVSVAYEKAYERVFEEEYGPKRTLTRAGAFLGADERSSGKHHFFLSGASQINKTYGFNARAVYRIGHFDYDLGNGPKFPRVSPAALLNPRARFDPGRGNLLELSGNFSYQPTNTLLSTFSFIKSRLVRDDTGLVAYDDNIVSSRTTYQFTRFTFVRARIDYSTLASRARGQFLLGWTPNPGTSFYAGYNDDVNRNGFNPFTGLNEPGFRRNGRTFFVKMSYLFRRSL